MAILKIAKMGHPVLRQPAEAVDDPTTPEIKALLDDMLATMIDAEGAGLAAPQAVAMEVAAYLVQVVFSLVGGVLLLTGRWDRQRSASATGEQTGN